MKQENDNKCSIPESDMTDFSKAINEFSKYIQKEINGDVTNEKSMILIANDGIITSASCLGTRNLITASIVKSMIKNQRIKEIIMDATMYVTLNDICES